MLNATRLAAVGAALALLMPSAPRAQGAALDTLVAWRSYSDTREARVRVYPCDDDDRPRTVVLDDPVENGGLVTDEIRYVAELVGRSLRFDPAEATFVLRYTAAAFTPGATDRGRALLLRVTFRRTDSGELGPPSWRVNTPDALEELTDRQLR